MGDRTSIQWTDATWNPLRGCSRISPGCTHCYAERIAARFSGPGRPFDGLASMMPGGPRWTGRVRLVPRAMTQPLRWRRPRRIFVNSVSDLFHESLTNEQIALLFAAMAVAPQHTFQVLTKRARRMRKWFQWAERFAPDAGGAGPLRAIWEAIACDSEGAWPETWDTEEGPPVGNAWPLPNVWLGVSVEDQQRADERIPELLSVPAAVRFLSCEPLLGPVEIGSGRGIDWVIVGGESGHGARPFDLAWARSLVAQCKAADVALFVKQLGACACDAENGLAGALLDVHPDAAALVSQRLHDRSGADPSEWPEDLRVREFPGVQR